MQRIKLYQNEVAHVPQHTVVDSGALGPCIAVFVYHPQRQEAFACHFVDVLSDGLEGMVKEALSRLGSAQDMNVYIAGGGVDDDEEEEVRVSILQDREAVAALLLKYQFRRPTTYVRWSPPFTMVNLLLNVDNGRSTLRVRCLDGSLLYKGSIQRSPQASALRQAARDAYFRGID